LLDLVDGFFVLGLPPFDFVESDAGFAPPDVLSSFGGDGKSAFGKLIVPEIPMDESSLLVFPLVESLAPTSAKTTLVAVSVLVIALPVGQFAT
jgi:hypothetical protein